MLRAIVLGAVTATLLAAAPTFAAQTPSPPNAEEYIIWPPDGA